MFWSSSRASLDVPARPEQVIEVCQNTARSLDMRVKEESGGRLVICSRFPNNGMVLVFVDVAALGEGSRCLLTGKSGLWNTGLWKRHTGLLLGHFVDDLETTFAQGRGSGSAGSGGEADPSAEPRPALSRRIRVGESLCLAVGVPLMFSGLAIEPSPGEVLMIVGAWVSFAVFALEIWRRRVICSGSLVDYYLAMPFLAMVSALTWLTLTHW